MQKNKIVLSQSQRDEILKLIDVLQQHKLKYACFKSFIKTCDDALTVADALLQGNYNIFKRYALKYSNHTAEKMRGMRSLSTYKKTSNICMFLSQHDCICKKCYAERSIKLYEAALLPLLIYNTLLLKYIDICADQIPYINDRYFRFEAFSDLQSAKHLNNLFKVCKKNKNTLFTLWTKAGYTLNNMMTAENLQRIPNNLNIIVSEVYINKKTDQNYLENLQTVLYPQQSINKSYKNYLKCFVVYDDENKRNASNMFLCKNKCIDCLKCYKKTKKLLYIAEKLH